MILKMLKGILINKILHKLGLKLSLIFERHLDKEDKPFLEIYNKSRPYTMTSIERVYSLYKAVEYIVKLKVPGDMVECGVWKGGSSMAIASTLLKMNDTTRKIYLYDTYAGMSEPTHKDVDFLGRLAIKEWEINQEDDFNKWAYSALEETKRNLFKTGYPKENLLFVKGRVEETIPKIIPDNIALLRLDTDWYDSTYHELRYLFPRLSVNGIVIIDDYDFFKGQREAVDKYFKENNINMLLNIIDGAGRIGIKIK